MAAKDGVGYRGKVLAGGLVVRMRDSTLTVAVVVWYQRPIC